MPTETPSRAYHGPHVLLLEDELHGIRDLLILHCRPWSRPLLTRVEHALKLNEQAIEKGVDPT